MNIIVFILTNTKYSKNSNVYSSTIYFGIFYFHLFQFNELSLN